MFTIAKVFHVSHAVEDLAAAVAWYADVFSPRVWQETELFGTSLALLVVGDTVLMPMQPGLGTAPRRFLDRFGPRLHSLALYVDEPVEPQPRESPMVFELFQPRPVVTWRTRSPITR